MLKLYIKMLKLNVKNVKTSVKHVEPLHMFFTFVLRLNL